MNNIIVNYRTRPSSEMKGFFYLKISGKFSYLLKRFL